MQCSNASLLGGDLRNLRKVNPNNFVSSLTRRVISGKLALVQTTLDYVSCLSLPTSLEKVPGNEVDPLHFVRAPPLLLCFTTQQSTVEASLFVN